MNISKLNSLIDGESIMKAKIIKLTGISRPTLDSILDGNDFKVSNLEKIANALNIKVGYFFDEEITEHITATGQRGVAAHQVNTVDNSVQGCDENGKVKELEAQVVELQGKLLDAQAEIITLMKERK